MKNVVVTLILAWVLGSAPVSFAALPVNCQMDMLGVAHQAYTEEWNQFSQIFVIEDIAFEYPQAGKANVLFSGPNCNARIKMTYPVCEACGGCPTYSFADIEVSCN